MARIPEESKYKVSANFQKRLLNIIEEKDLTKNSFAEAAGVNKDIIIRATVYAIVPSVKSLIKIADYLACPLLYLLGESEDTLFVPSAHAVTFHERLKILTAERGIRYSDLSHAMTFAPNSVYEWFRTKSLPSPDYLIELADFFDVSLDYLLGRTDYRK